MGAKIIVYYLVHGVHGQKRAYSGRFLTASGFSIKMPVLATREKKEVEHDEVS
jgi:hypothetical protein